MFNKILIAEEHEIANIPCRKRCTGWELTTLNMFSTVTAHSLSWDFQKMRSRFRCWNHLAVSGYL
jgi:hypothetical protein